MIKKTEIEKYALNLEGIDKISESITEFCNVRKIDDLNTIRYRMSAEDSLMTWYNGIDKEGTEVTVEKGTKFGRPFLKLVVPGTQINPYEINYEDENFGTGKNDFLLKIGVIPEYSYANGKNILIFRPKRKSVSQVTMLLLVIVSAFVVGILGNLLIPENVISFVSNDIITPLESAFFRVLSTIAGPMIFLSVAWGVYGIGDVYTLGKIGKKMMIAFLKVIFCCSIVAMCFYPLLGPQITEASIEENQFAKIFEMILSAIPSNIFQPFSSGNTLQIILLAIIIGMSMIFLGQRTSSIARAVEQINLIISFLMEFVSKMVPYFVFIVMVKIVWSKSMAAVLQVWKFALVFIAALLTVMVLFLIYSAIRNRQNPIVLLKMILPSYLIALTTASSSATFESNMRICNEKFNIKKEMSSFGIPFGMVVFKPAAALYYLLVCFYYADVNDVPISIGWLVTAFFITEIISIAVPPIPGGATAVYSILFLQLGIPSTSLAIVVAIDMLFDFFITSGNMYFLLIEMYNISGKLGMRTKSNISKTDIKEEIR